MDYEDKDEHRFHKIEIMRYRWGKKRRLSFPLGSAFVLTSGKVRMSREWYATRPLLKSLFLNIH